VFDSQARGWRPGQNRASS